MCQRCTALKHILRISMADLVEGSPPYLHTRYLTADELFHCSHNPTYGQRLADLQRLREDIHHHTASLQLIQDDGSNRKRQIRDAVTCVERLENDFMRRDNELAELAEGLLQWDVSQIKAPVRLFQGKWVWMVSERAPCRKLPRSEIGATSVRTRKNSSILRSCRRLPKLLKAGCGMEKATKNT